MLITTHDISNHFVKRSDYPAIVLSTLGCVQICQYMYIHLKKEFFELHFSCTKHQCTTVLSVVRIGPSSLVSSPLLPPNCSPASNANGLESDAIREQRRIGSRALVYCLVSALDYGDCLSGPGRGVQAGDSSSIP